ncbi:MAG: hypothetical protein IT342_27595 [Candidatus Melainabacteria bacterium]|nr:hypothetical protein [Candidatus Melainabacteria bacterium]
MCRFILTGVSFLLFSLFTNNASLAQSTPTGAWVLESVTPAKVVEKGSDVYTNQFVDIGTDLRSISGGCTLVDRPRKTSTQIRFSVNWTPLPTSMSPDTKVPLTTVTAAGASAEVKWHHLFLLEIMSRNPTGTAYFQPPKGQKQGDILPIVVGGGRGGLIGGATVTYKYRWDGNAVASTGSSSNSSSGTASTPPNTASVSTSTPGSKEPVTAAHTTIQVAKRSVPPGSKVVVPVWLIKGAGLGSLSFNITYNSAIAKAVAISKGNLLERASFQGNSNQNAIVRVATAVSGEIGGPDSGTVAQLTFQTKGQAGSRTPLHVNVTAATGSASPQTIAKIDGEIAIVGQASVVKGDKDGDGVVTARDADQALKMDVQLIPEDKILDMDNSGKVDSTDARLILRKAVGK